MTINTLKLLDSTDINDVARAYSLAYLRKKKVKINKFEAEIDNHWNLGKFEEGYLLRTEDNSIFTLFNFPEIADKDIAKSRQIVGSNLHENFVNIIAHFIATGRKDLPCNNLKISMCINHNNGHWTQLLATFSGLNQREYKALFNAYHKHAKDTIENEYDDGSKKPFNIIRNNVVNFIKANKNISFNGDVKDQLGNYQLPLTINNIALDHFDSLGKKTAYATSVANSIQAFAKKHKTKLMAADCPRQTGMTCGDWCVYNGFQNGVVQSKKKPPTSTNLRQFYYNRDVNNAHQILYAAKPNIKKVAKKDQINISRNAQLLDDNYVAQFKDFGAKVSPYAGQTFFALVTGFLFYGALALIATNPILPIIGAIAVSITTGLFYQRLSTAFFGQKSVVLEKKDGKPVVKEKLEHKGWGEYLGFDKPVQKDLESLENDIKKLINEDGSKDEQQVEMLTHQYAKKIIEQNPSFFSQQDKAVVKLDGYAPKLTAR
jgi:hypothetical protein